MSPAKLTWPGVLWDPLVKGPYSVRVEEGLSIERGGFGLAKGNDVIAFVSERSTKVYPFRNVR